MPARHGWWVGRRSRKDSLRIECYGTVDELMAASGWRARRWPPEAPPGPPAGGGPRPVQNELFNLGSDLATLPDDRHPSSRVIEARHVEALEHEIDALERALPELRSFVLPGGGWVAAYLHLARTVCRRAERLVVRLAATRAGRRARDPLPQPPVGRPVRHEPPRRPAVRPARAALGAREDLSATWSRASSRLARGDRILERDAGVQVDVERELVNPSNAFVPNVSANAGLTLYMMPAPTPAKTGPAGTVSTQV